MGKLKLIIFLLLPSLFGVHTLAQGEIQSAQEDIDNREICEPLEYSYVEEMYAINALNEYDFNEIVADRTFEAKADVDIRDILVADKYRYKNYSEIKEMIRLQHNMSNYIVEEGERIVLPFCNYKNFSKRISNAVAVELNSLDDSVYFLQKTNAESSNRNHIGFNYGKINTKRDQLLLSMDYVKLSYGKRKVSDSGFIFDGSLRLTSFFNIQYSESEEEQTTSGLHPEGGIFLGKQVNDYSYGTSIEILNYVLTNSTGDIEDISPEFAGRISVLGKLLLPYSFHLIPRVGYLSNISGNGFSGIDFSVGLSREIDKKESISLTLSIDSATIQMTGSDVNDSSSVFSLGLSKDL